mgnify:CR=1 FL=1
MNEPELLDEETIRQLVAEQDTAGFLRRRLGGLRMSNEPILEEEIRRLRQDLDELRLRVLELEAELERVRG